MIASVSCDMRAVKVACIGKPDAAEHPQMLAARADIVKVSAAARTLPGARQEDIADRLRDVARYLAHEAYGAANYELRLIQASITSSRLAAQGAN